MERQILTNARVVLEDRELDGTVVIEDGRISEVSAGHAPEGIDLNGAFLTPGVIDMHTDYLEKEITPRPGAEIPLPTALHLMDLRALSCGLTFVFSAMRIVADPASDDRPGLQAGKSLQTARLFEELAPGLRARHRIHARFDTRFEPVEEVVEGLLTLRTIGNVVYNDSMPGQRQHRDMDALVATLAARRGLSPDEARVLMEARIEKARATDNRRTVTAALGGRFPIGSHDDTTVEHVVESFEAGATLCEMPCSIEAARKAKSLDMMVCMGAPNYYRGGSHCGNLSARDAMDEGLVNILCSDYHFMSLLSSAAQMMRSGMPPSAAMRFMTLNPARYLGLEAEFGSIAVGKRADLVAFHVRDEFADVTHTWVDGTLQFFSAGATSAKLAVPA